MKNYIVKATKPFTDSVEKVDREVGDVFECEKERYIFLNEHNAVELIEEKNDTPKEDKQEEVKVETDKKESKKKKTSKK